MDKQDEALKCSPNWKRPEEVMKYYHMKIKKRALTRRCLNAEDKGDVQQLCTRREDVLLEFPPAKRRNPFRRVELSQKSSNTEQISSAEEIKPKNISSFSFFSEHTSSGSSDGSLENPKIFENFLLELNNEENKAEFNKPTLVSDKPKKRVLPLDWSLKTKLRFMATTSFSWNAKLKTCEEASGITGFVRCLNTSNMTNCSLDTSHNARFHQCCLYWQHPNLPWLELFPRNAISKNASTFSRAQLSMAALLQAEWEKAFRSLFQLITARQCPYFYALANNFTCLFRAAGIGGIVETHVIVTPTTRGLRKLLEDEDVEYRMPLKQNKSGSNTEADSELNELGVDDDEDDWLASFDTDSQDVKKFATSQRVIEHNQEKRVDKFDESLILIKGSDAQAFFNVLLNCKTFVSNVGAMAGIPPTLLSPTSFSLATLKSLKVKNGVVHVDGTDFYSIEIEGPILPHSLREMCHLLNSDNKEFSAVLAAVKETKGFTTFRNSLLDQDKSQTGSTIFLKANLSDCGLSAHVLEAFCEDGSFEYSVIESIEPNQLAS